MGRGQQSQCLGSLDTLIWAVQSTTIAIDGYDFLGIRILGPVSDFCAFGPQELLQVESKYGYTLGFESNSVSYLLIMFTKYLKPFRLINKIPIVA